MSKVQSSILIILFSSLMACGGGGGTDIPASRPSGSVNGVVHDAPVSGATVKIYSFANGVKGALLGEARTLPGGGGFFTIPLQVSDQPIRVEATGGQYTEEASGTLVTIAPDEGLIALSFFRSGVAHTINLTPFTMLTTGLAEYRIATGELVSSAIQNAATIVSDLIGMDVDVVATTPRNIQISDDNPTPVVDATVLYGFTVSSLSSYTAFLSKKADSEHSEYPSFDFAKVMYEDIRDDGVLDGKSLDQETGDPTQLIFANVELAQEIYRSAIAQHMLIMANSPVNKTGISAQDLLENAKRVASSNSPEFPGVGGDPSLDIDGPTITAVEPEGLYYSAVLNFAVAVEDSSPIASVNFDVDGDPLGNNIDVANPVVAIDTTKYADGEHTIGVTAFDDIGNLNSTNFTVFFDNTNPMVVIGSVNITNLRSFTIFGTYERNGSELSLFQIQGVDVAVAADNTWQSDVLLDPGVNTIPIVAVDSAGNRTETNTLVSLDERLPKFSQLRYSQTTVFFADPGCFIATLDTADVNGRPLYFNNTKLVLSEQIQLTFQKTQYGWVDLEFLNVPYFRFFVEDQRSNPSDVFTPSGEIIVRMQYALGDNVLVPWQQMQVHIDPNPGSPYYLIPFASDTLHPDWSMANATNIHTISVELEDLAGNIRPLEFRFKAFFDVNDCVIN